MQLPSQLRPAANLSISPRAQTKPAQPETGLPAPTCPRNAALVRNVSGKAEGPWNQSPSLGTYATRHKGRDVQSRERCACQKGGSLCWFVEERTLAHNPNDKGWMSAEKPLPTPSPASARVGKVNASALVRELRTDTNTACDPGGKISRAWGWDDILDYMSPP